MNSEASKLLLPCEIIDVTCTPLLLAEYLAKSLVAGIGALCLLYLARRFGTLSVPKIAALLSVPSAAILAFLLDGFHGFDGCPFDVPPYPYRVAVSYDDQNRLAFVHPPLKVQKGPFLFRHLPGFEEYFADHRPDEDVAEAKADLEALGYHVTIHPDRPHHCRT